MTICKTLPLIPTFWLISLGAWATFRKIYWATFRLQPMGTLRPMVRFSLLLLPEHYSDKLRLLDHCVFFFKAAFSKGDCSV